MRVMTMKFMMTIMIRGDVSDEDHNNDDETMKDESNDDEVTMKDESNDDEG
jgi:hypothetical protein